MKQRNQPIGTCPCDSAGCGQTATVHKMRGTPKGAAGPLYLVCPDCGQVRKTSERFQNYILENATMEAPEKPEPATPKPEPAPVEVPEPQPAPEPKKPEKSGFLAGLFNIDV